MVLWGANGRIAGCGLSADAPIRRKIAMRTSTPKQERMEPYVCTGARPWERPLSPAAGPTRLARASVVRGGFSASSPSETGLVYRGRSTCVTSSCGCSTSSNSSSLSPLRSSSDIDGYRRESGGVWEGCWELCFVNVRVLPVAVGKLVRTYTFRQRTAVSYRSSSFFSFFLQRYSPTGTVTASHAWVGSARPLLELVGARHAQERGRGAGRPGQLEADEQLGGASRRGVDHSISESANSSRWEAARSNEKLTQLKHRAGSARGLLASR